LVIKVDYDQAGAQVVGCLVSQNLNPFKPRKPAQSGLRCYCF